MKKIFRQRKNWNFPKLKNNNVSIASVLERIDDSPESVMMEAMLEGMAEYYSKKLSREVMKGMNETALQCKHTGGCTPLGYCLDENRKCSLSRKIQNLSCKIQKISLKNLQSVKRY